MKLNLNDAFFKIGEELSLKTQESAHFSISYEEEFLLTPNKNKNICETWSLKCGI